MSIEPERTRDMALDATQTLTDATASELVSRQARSGLQRGELLGRYVALTELGAGAMGVVWAAYDPELDRKLAIKLLKSRTADPRSRARLQREAQALAKLGHPNVVAVYDVGVHRDLLFVAMEHVAGQTLGNWMRAASAPRPWRELLRVFDAAGRGLAAAHAVGLVHRDFKPDNVMLGDDGRVRVMDFGLARTELDADDHDAHASAESIEDSQPDHRLTRTGTIMGTPLYMPIEQHEGRPADARSDQFSFCVALWEALYGQRPFVGHNIVELRDAIGHGRVSEPPRGSSVPVWLRRVVERGLAVQATRRWPNMTALLDALADDPAVRRRRWLVGSGLVGLLAGLVGVLLSTPDQEQQHADVCAGLDAKLDGVWDAERRGAVQTAMLATRVERAPAIWAAVEQQLDAYTRAWVAGRVEACQATQRGEQSSELLDLRMACLDERLAHVRALVDELESADADMLDKITQAANDLPRLDRCTDIDALRSAVAPPDDPAIAARVRELEEQLIEAETKRQLARLPEGLATADAVVLAAAQIEYEPLVALASLQQARMLESLGHYERSVAALELAYDAALAQRMLEEAAMAASLLMDMTGNRLGQVERGQCWATNANPLSRAATSQGARVTFLDGVAALAYARGHYAEARNYYEERLRIDEVEYGTDYPELLHTLSNLGLVLIEQGEFDDARRHLERALIVGAPLGDEHPAIATALYQLAKVELHDGNLVEARSDLLRALAIREHMLGPQHPNLAGVLISLAEVALQEGRLDEAREFNDRARTLIEQHFGPNHKHIGYVLGNRAEIEAQAGNYALAREHALASLAILESTLEPSHPSIAIPLTALGRALIGLGEQRQAVPVLERAASVNLDPLRDADIARLLAHGN